MCIDGLEKAAQLLAVGMKVKDVAENISVNRATIWHWKNDPNMPGMLQIEALVQMSALSILTLPGNKGKVMYLTSANNLKFIKKIIPNSRLYIDTEIKSYKRGIAICKGEGIVNKEIVCKADFSLILPDEINKYNLKK